MTTLAAIRGTDRLACSPDLSVAEREIVGGALRPSRSVASGEVLDRGDHVSGDLLILDEGWAIRALDGDGDKRQITAILLPGDPCNLADLTSDRARESVTMLTDGRVFSMPLSEARALGRDHPGIARAFLTLALEDHARLSELLYSIGRRQAPERLACLLGDLGQRLGSSRFELPLTQNQLADMLGITNVHVNRVLRQLRDGGLIETFKRQIVLSDMDALRRIGEQAALDVEQRCAA